MLLYIMMSLYLVAGFLNDIFKFTFSVFSSDLNMEMNSRAVKSEASSALFRINAFGALTF